MMLTGDAQATADHIAAELGIEHVRAECLPADKVHEVAAIAERPVIMVGDGVNDAPVLAAADVGVAMGARGATAASESADAVILVDDISRTAKAVEIGRDTVRIALQSIWLGIIVSVALVLVAAFGMIPATIRALLQELVDLAGDLRLRAIGGRRDAAGGGVPPPPGVSPPAEPAAPPAPLARPRWSGSGGGVVRLRPRKRVAKSLFVRFTNKRAAGRNQIIASPGSHPRLERVCRCSPTACSAPPARSSRARAKPQPLARAADAYTQGAQSRADVARETALTRVTVSDLVAELIGEGLVVELGQREDARPGKPATLIDIDRTGFHRRPRPLRAHPVPRGRARPRRSHRRPGRGRARRRHGRRAVELVLELLDGLLALTTARVLGIGVGSPGVVEPNGVVHSAPNLGWTDLPLQERLAAAFHLPVHVANDANVAVLAEHASAPATSSSSRSATASAPASSSAAAPCSAPARPRARSATSWSAPTAAALRVRQARLRGVAGRAAPDRRARAARFRRMPRHPSREETLREAGRRLGMLAPSSAR